MCFRNRLLIFILLLAPLACIAEPTTAAQLLYKVTAPDPQPGAKFGHTVSVVDGDVLVSEPSRFHPDTGVGRAYLFDGASGELRHTLNNPELGNQDALAGAIAGGDGRIFVSTIGLEERVYGFDAGTGELERRIDDPNAPPPGTRGGKSSFGVRLGYDNGDLLVSAPAFDLSPELQRVGQIYLFDVVDGGRQRSIGNPEPKEDDGFGAGVSLHGNYIVVGAITDDLPGDDAPGGDNPGRVWVFDRETGDVAFTLENPNPEAEYLDWFGWAVAANDEVILVGAQEDESSGFDHSGTSYLFSRETGDLLRTLYSPNAPTDGPNGGEFGRSVALTPDGDIVVGAWGEYVDGVRRAGRVYLFDGQTGDLLQEISNPDPSVSAAFGWSVAAMEDRIVVGAYQSNAGGLSATGAVYVYSTIPEPNSFQLALLMHVAVVATRLRSLDE